MIVTKFNKYFYGAKHPMETTLNTACAFQIRALAIAIACFSSASFAIQGTDYIESAKYQTLDKYSVNTVGNQVTPTVETVSIGGALGLKHSITVMGNYFDLSHGFNGYQDKYSGGIRETHLGTKSVPGFPQIQTDADAIVMRASFLGQNADFQVFKNDNTYVYYHYVGTDFYYRALGDKRHTLERRTDGLVWTQPDGTEVFFVTGDVTNSTVVFSNFAVKKIVYPNGFTIELPPVGVITNTGFALKYDFDSADPGLELSKQSKVFPPDNNVPAVSSDFISSNPKYVRAINTAIEACNIASSAPCTLVNKWPTATFTWPGGMPRAMFIDRSTFSVTNAAGGKTDFIYEAQDAGKSNNSIPSNTADKLIAPRLVEIKPAGASASSTIYTYTNEKPNIIPTESGPYVTNVPDYRDYGRLLPGILTSATGVLGAQDYATGDLGSSDGHNSVIKYGKSYRSGHDLLVLQYTTGAVGTLLEVDDGKGDRIIKFENGWRNFVSTESFGPDPQHSYPPQKVYEYDDRGNLSKITQGTLISRAGYPGDCPNRKTCNKPAWVIDPNGNQTDYTYHPESGQIQTVTSSADKRGIRAQTRYEYEQFQASYFNATGVSTVGSPIWLKTAEKSCTNSNYTGSLSGGKFSSGCADGKEVVTRYEYKSKNRLMTAQIVEADGKQYRTCFQYDIYGNQIGKTEPKAGLGVCPQEWSGN